MTLSDKEKDASPTSKPSSRVPEQARVPKPGTSGVLLGGTSPSKITSRAHSRVTTKWLSIYSRNLKFFVPEGAITHPKSYQAPRNFVN